MTSYRSKEVIARGSMTGEISISRVTRTGKLYFEKIEIPAKDVQALFDIYPIARIGMTGKRQRIIQAIKRRLRHNTRAYTLGKGLAHSRFRGARANVKLEFTP